MYLPPGLNVAMMYRMYCAKVDEPLSIKMYRIVFKKIGLKIKAPQVDQCNKCSEFKMKLRHEKDENIKMITEEEKKQHQEDAAAAYEAKRLDKIAVLNSQGTKELLTGDLQKCLGTPMLSVGMSYYKRNLSTLNYTVHGTLFNTKCYMWHEAIARRGGNEISSCLFKHLNDLPPEVTHAILYSDCCPGQNRNKILSAMLAAFIHHHPTLQIFDHKYLTPGHTHMECDSDHSLIERGKKAFGTEVHYPQDWYDLVRRVKLDNPMEVVEMRSEDFYNFEELFHGTFVMRKKNEDKEPFVWRNVKWIRYTKKQGSFLYKTSLAPDAPFKEMNLKKRGKPTFILQNKIKVCNEKLIPISKEKKNDLLELLPFLRPEVHKFYESLPCETDAKNIDYDLDSELSEEEDLQDGTMITQTAGKTTNNLELKSSEADVNNNKSLQISDSNEDANETVHVEESNQKDKITDCSLLAAESSNRRKRRVVKKKINTDYVYYK